MGVAQVVEARILLRQGGALLGSVAWLSGAEFLWTLFGLYLLVTGRLESARWLGIMFLAYIPVAIVVGMVADPRLIKDPPPPEALRVPRAGIYLGGFFGVSYAIAALAFLAR